MALFAALQSGQQRIREGKPLPLSRATGTLPSTTPSSRVEPPLAGKAMEECLAGGAILAGSCHAASAKQYAAAAISIEAASHSA